MRVKDFTMILRTGVRAAAVLLLGAGLASAQQQVNLAAGASTITLPDGSSVPMWGYSCGAVVAGSTASCGALNPHATGWSPVVITVPTGQDLQINLTNSLPAPVPTSLVIVGQLGGGLGTTATSNASPTHDNQGTTWPIANSGAVFIPPPQGARVQSFATEVAPTATTSLTWKVPNPGTYLIESGTHPSIQGPMGLYGMLVVTCAPGSSATCSSTPGTAYPAVGSTPPVTYAAEAQLLFSEIDPNQNRVAAAAVATSGFSESATYGVYTGGPVASINLTNPGSGYTSAPTVTFNPTGATATAVIDTDPTSPTYHQITEIDPPLNSATYGGTYTTAPSVTISGGGGSGATATAALQLNGNELAHCSGGAAACYPPVVNYSPLYYLINGVAFDKTNASNSLFGSVPASPGSGNVLVRMVNAGLRMHIPSLVGTQTGTVVAPAVPPTGFSLIAEDGKPLPGTPRVQSEVFMAAGKTYDVMINGPTCTGTGCAVPAVPVFDRQLSLSGNATARDAGMLAYIGVNGGTLPNAGSLGAATANPDTYNSVIPSQTLTVSDPFKGVIANDVNVYGVAVTTAPTKGTLKLSADGTFSYTPSTGWSGGDSFKYCGNGTIPTTSNPNPPACATVTLGAAPIEAGSGITVNADAYTSKLAAHLSISAPGILANDSDSAGYPLTVVTTSIAPQAGLTVAVNEHGGFDASISAPCGTPAGCPYTFTYKAQNSQGTSSASSATVTITFQQKNGPSIRLVDGATHATLPTSLDYRWVVEEDRTFYVDPTKTTNTGTAGSTNVLTYGTNFHTSFMPLIAQGCTGTDSPSCGAGQYVKGIAAPAQTPVDPSELHLDTTKHYYITVLPGDAATPFNTGNGSPGHGMGGASLFWNGTAWVSPTAPTVATVSVIVEPTPLPPSKLTVFVFEDDFPLNGEQDAGGGVDVLAPDEPGLGGFNITIFDDAGGTGDATGQVDYDMFNQPLSNSLAGTIDPATTLDACPISPNGGSRTGALPNGQTDLTQTGLAGVVVTCPKYESDGKTLSPLAGQAVIANMMPGRYGVVATPGADRIGRGEEWLQTNTLDGQKAHDSFLKVGEPAFFQEYGPASFHVTIGFANPKVINARLAGVCNGKDINITGSNCTNSVTGQVTTERMSRTPDERLYSSGSYDSFAFTQCYVSFGDPDGEDFAFTKCNADGTFTLSGLPDGVWRVTVFDQWNDMLVDGLSTPVRLGGGKLIDMGDIATNQWQANIYTRTFFDPNGTGVPASDTSPGLALVPTNIRFRDGSYSNFNNTDLNGFAGFNEEFPLFNWYVVETDDTRYKNTGTHVVYDSGGPSDGSAACGKPGVAACGSSAIGNLMARTYEDLPLPVSLRVPGAVYCNNADCTGFSIANGPASSATSNISTGRIDPPWVKSEGWQGFSGENSFIEFGKKPFKVGENGGIHGHVVYASTRPFDDPQLLLQLSWEPLVPGVTINLYQEGTAPDGSTSLKLVDSTKTSSWDDWAQGFRSDGAPNMNCPGQGTATGTDADLFFYSLYNQPMFLDAYNNGGTPAHTIPNNSQYKCYDGMHNWNQVQPAQYDGRYEFPSIIGRDPVSGAPTGTGATNGTSGSRAGSNCTICVANPDDGTPMLPSGKYVVEVVVPQGYELVKEEDKNILIGDNYLAPVTVQFPGLGGSVFILPDQASVSSPNNTSNPQNPTQGLGRDPSLPSHEGDTGSVETFWPCVGEPHIVPDYISLFPGSNEVAPFAGATRPLCDRKEVTLDDQTSALAKFYVFTSTHVAAHYTGVITDDFTSEFDPFSPQFGEKFAPPDLPISVKDWNGNEINRVYADHFGAYNGLNYSTWEVNPPNPTGYSPTMMTMCMNDPGSASTPDPLFNPSYSQFCYELPFMPGQTQYMDTPVTPTSAFAGAGYNNVDCAYPDATPAIKEVDGDGVGPWILAQGTSHPITITALGNQQVNNNAYSGPSATSGPYNAKTITRNYGFGATKGTVTIGGQTIPAASITTWSDTKIVLTIPTSGTGSAIPACPGPTQQSIYTGSAAKCGQLVITAANGKQSIDAVTVTIGGKAPIRVGTALYPTIQAAIDSASPGDLVIVPPGVYNEIVLMWKPVRLQGVGAASSVINANTHPAGKLNPWRDRVNCLFGLALNGQPRTDVPGGDPTKNPYDPTGAATCGNWTAFDAAHPQVDRLPLEGILGWDTTVNGNLAQLLQEPTLMGAYEGAGITVLGKGIKLPTGTNPFSTDAFGSGAESAFPAGTNLLSAKDCLSSGKNPYPSNFYCNPSSIDGLSITDSSQGGGGIFVHAWGHNLQVANNRIYNNTGTLTGGITVGQGESPDAYLQGDAGNADPGSCETSLIAGKQLPYCFDYAVNVHNNAVTLNSSIGDELYSATPAGGGGVTICTGADYYQFNYNWVCGNLSSGDGGGLVHLGFIKNGQIQHNSILFNQSTNPTVPTNGGGILAMGAPPDGLTTGGAECGNTAADADCTPGLSDGTGPGLVINANLIMGNSAESGSGGGIRLQNVNGTEVIAFPNPLLLGLVPTSTLWNDVTLTNNIIANNVAGWDGAGISLVDALNVNIINNTIMSNDTTASSGVLFNTLGAPISSSQGPPSSGQTQSSTTSAPQPAGLVAIQNSPVLSASIQALTPNLLGTRITCPTSHAQGALANGSCATVSYPLLYNDLFWQNRSFYIGVGSLGQGTVNQQNVVALYNAFSSNQVKSQSSTAAQVVVGGGKVITGGTGACDPSTVSSTSANFWDIGVRGDLGPTDHSSLVTLTPVYSLITAGYTGTASNHNSNSNPTVVSQYCNGSRTPPELGGAAGGTWQVPPGISDATVPNPIFNLQPAATVDEGNNWINIAWGPLTMFNPVNGGTLGNYSLGGGSPAVNYIPSTANGATGAYTLAPSFDFLGNARKTNNFVDVGAVEFQAPAGVNVLPTTLTFPNTVVGTTSVATLTLYDDTGAGINTIAVGGFIGPFARATAAQGGPGTCGATLAANNSCTINLAFTPTSATSFTGSVNVTANVTVNGSPVTLTGTGVAATRTLTVSPASLSFGSWFAGTASGPQTLTVTNTGNIATGTGFAVAFAGGTPQPFSHPAGTAGGTCTATTTLAVGATCTVNVIFTAPATLATYNRTLSVTWTGETVTPTVNLTGTSVNTRATVAITPNPLTITLPTGVLNLTGTGVVTLANTSATGGTSTLVTNVGVSGGSAFTYFFNVVAGSDTCTGVTLAPQTSCTVTVRFTNVLSPRGTNRTGTISFTDSATGSPQAGQLIGFATP